MLIAGIVNGLKMLPPILILYFGKYAVLAIFNLSKNRRNVIWSICHFVSCHFVNPSYKYLVSQQINVNLKWFWPNMFKINKIAQGWRNSASFKSLNWRHDTQHKNTPLSNVKHYAKCQSYEESVVDKFKSNLLLMIIWLNIINYNS